MKTIQTTIQTTILKSKYVLLSLLVVFSISCSTEDGEDGPIGPAGTNGTNGNNGEDGNANVQTFTFDASNFAGLSNSVSISAITADVLENDVILAYLNDGNLWTPVPCPADISGFNYAVDVNLSIGHIMFDYSNGIGEYISITAGSLSSGKVIIIESTNTTTVGKTINAKQQIYNELNQAGVDINDYYAVCNYYGIAH